MMSCKHGDLHFCSDCDDGDWIIGPKQEVSRGEDSDS